MFLELPHKRMDVYAVARELFVECRKATESFPGEEKYVLQGQIRRAALSVFLNIAEGSSRKSTTERKRFYEIARSSVVEIDAGFDAANTAGYIQQKDIEKLGGLVIRTFQMLSGLINNT